DNVTLDKTPEKSGYTFDGWYSDKELKNKITSVTMNSSKTVYAGWSQGAKTPLLVVKIDDTKYQLNGKNMEMDSAPFIDENDRTMLPVRVVANVLGISDADIAWDDNTKTASFTRPDGKVVSCTVGSNIIKISDEEVVIDTAPVIRNDRIYLPMRALFNAFNVSDDHIAWDGAARKVTVAKEALDDINALTEVAPVEEEPVEEVPAEETPAAETPAEETPAEEA
ncbi:MAG: InlB B-repeat-containing protein, partial [Firmicutes bacterium]|nr:InlB B-repeat-containing protein [Bacillota bacterium]